MANTFPMTSVHEMQQLFIQQLSAFVPAAPDAWELSELFYKRTTWMFDLITKEEFVETIFAVVYAGESPSTAGITPHDLGLMFSACTISGKDVVADPPLSDIRNCVYGRSSPAALQCARLGLLPARARCDRHGLGH